MTVPAYGWPYIHEHGKMYRLRLDDKGEMQTSPYILGGVLKDEVYEMEWDDFALFDPKPWVMQPGDLGL